MSIKLGRSFAPAVSRRMRGRQPGAALRLAPGAGGDGGARWRARGEGGVRISGVSPDLRLGPGIVQAVALFLAIGRP
ncbi:hypothetical protein scyTo_0009944 [Scyliorhinus torazame]|uniref:Uncharacterized protein n=1 Tax=Scyliorhinus torazame TaxID=75743 RepID=A0A401NWQ6_SCYTO|nr:hypothetical protein [Scyliorhinus torazame]